MPAMPAIARLFYDSQARRLGPLLRGHFLLFDRKEAPTYSSATGLRLLAIFAVLELVVGPRFALFSWLGLSPPPAGLRVGPRVRSHNWMASPAAARVLPSGLNATVTTPVFVSKVAISSPLAVSHRPTPPLIQPAARVLPSGENATAVT